jgi:DNA repair protein RadC
MASTNLIPLLDTPASERPRERCLEHGAQALSLRECLSVILGSPSTASRLFHRFASAEMPEPEAERALFLALEAQGSQALVGLTRLGPAGITRLLAAFELARRYHRYRKRAETPWRHEVKSSLPEIAARALAKVPASLRSEVREWLGFVPIYRSEDVGELCLVERGVRTHVNTDPVELFARVLALRPTAIILVHNHPSGNQEASYEDHELTRRVGRLALDLGIRLLGHWIVGPGGTPQHATWIRLKDVGIG